MTAPTLSMYLVAVIPTLIIAGLITALLPLLVLLLIRRRSKRLSWGAMWLVQETLRRRARLKLLRILLFIIRSSVLPIAAAAIAGVWFLSVGSSSNQPQLIIVDDAIGAWVTGLDGRCAMDDHLDTLERLQDLSDDDMHVVLLSGRRLLSSGTEQVRALKPVSSGPDWTTALKQVRHLTTLYGIDHALLLSDIRSGTLITFNADELPAVAVHYESPKDTIRDTIRITGVDAPRKVLLPGDPFKHGQLVISLTRSNAITGLETKVLVDLLASDGTTVDDRHAETVVWQPGERNQLVFMTIPTDASSDGLLHMHVEGSNSPASKWWVRVQHHTSAEVTMITNARKQDFDPSSAASWVAAAVIAGSSDRSLTVRWLDHHDLQVDALPPSMPLIVIEPELLSGSTWSTLRDRVGAGPTLVIPSVDASTSWFNSFLEQLEGFESIDGLPITHRTIEGGEAMVSEESNPLKLLSGELQNLLRPVRIERLVDLNPLIQNKIASAVVSIGDQPLFAQINESNIIVSALSWHPSWSDLPIRGAAPAILQELIRSKSGGSGARDVIASSSSTRVAGPQSNGGLVQPNAAAAAQAKPDRAMLQQLTEAGWTTGTTYDAASTTQAWTTPLAIALLVLLTIELFVAHIIDRRRVSRVVQP